MNDLAKASLALFAAFAATAAIYAVKPRDAGRKTESAMNENNKRPDAVEAKALMEGGARLVDVRSLEEWDDGHVKGAVLLPHVQVADNARALLPDKDMPIVTYCRSGGRAELAARVLRSLGYTKVQAMTGGFEDLKAAGVPTE